MTLYDQLNNIYPESDDLFILITINGELETILSFSEQTPYNHADWIQEVMNDAIKSKVDISGVWIWRFKDIDFYVDIEYLGSEDDGLDEKHPVCPCYQI